MAAARGLSTRRGRWLAVLGTVLLAHAITLWWFDDAIIGWDAGRTPMPQRMEVAFVRTLEPAAPPAVAARPPAPAAPGRGRGACRRPLYRPRHARRWRQPRPRRQRSLLRHRRRTVSPRAARRQRRRR